MIRLAKRVVGVAAAVSVSMLVMPTFAAHSEGANTLQCSELFPQLGGVIVFQPNGGFKANCFEHLQDGTPGAEGETTVFDCSDAFPEIPPEQLVGIQVITASGNVLTNCKVHVAP